jgi:hypothetical protein
MEIVHCLASPVVHFVRNQCVIKTVTYPGKATSNLWFVIRCIDLLDKFKF